MSPRFRRVCTFPGVLIAGMSLSVGAPVFAQDGVQSGPPTATIGVGGTSFDIAVGENSTGVVLYSGSATVCDNSGRCTELEAGCGVAVAGQEGVFAAMSPAEKLAYIQEQFPYTFAQDVLETDFQVENAACVALLDVPLPPADLEIDEIAPGQIGSPS